MSITLSCLHVSPSITTDTFMWFYVLLKYVSVTLTNYYFSGSGTVS